MTWQDGLILWVVGCALGVAYAYWTCMRSDDDETN